jgi:hypothetical protein
MVGSQKKTWPSSYYLLTHIMSMYWAFVKFEILLFWFIETSCEILKVKKPLVNNIYIISLKLNIHEANEIQWNLVICL